MGRHLCPTISATPPIARHRAHTIDFHQLLACRRGRFAGIVAVHVVTRIHSTFRRLLGANILADEVAEPGQKASVHNLELALESLAAHSSYRSSMLASILVEEDFRRGLPEGCEDTRSSRKSRPA